MTDRVHDTMRKYVTFMFNSFKNLLLIQLYINTIKDLIKKRYCTKLNLHIKVLYQ